MSAVLFHGDSAVDLSGKEQTKDCGPNDDEDDYKADDRD
jgi:hypothetical protein